MYVFLGSREYCFSVYISAVIMCVFFCSLLFISVLWWCNWLKLICVVIVFIFTTASSLLRVAQKLELNLDVLPLKSRCLATVLYWLLIIERYLQDIYRKYIFLMHRNTSPKKLGTNRIWMHWRTRGSFWNYFLKWMSIF